MTEPRLADRSAGRSASERAVELGRLERAAGGDVAAFDEVLRPRLPRMFRMALAITRSDADARDAVQEASVNAWREVPRLRSRDKFDSWLDQILVNACRSLMRRTKRVRVREIDLSEGEHATGPATDSVSETDLIRRAFERLDADVRALLVLHYVEERPLAEIGRITGSPLGTVKWRLHNARRALEKALEVERR
jgi:RNA polymerase sigma-70 factor (ECF subfamily)